MSRLARAFVEHGCSTLSPSARHNRPAIANDGTVYIGSFDQYLYAIYPNGNLKWRYQTGGIVNSSPSISNDGTVYVGSWDGYLYAIYPNGSLYWKYQAATGGARINSSPAIASDSTIYVGSEDHGLYAIYPNGSLKWRYQTDMNIWGSTPAIGRDGTIYVGSEDRYLYAIYPDGSLKWRYQAGARINVQPAIASDGTIYVGSDDYGYNQDNQAHYLVAISTKVFSSISPWPQFKQNNLHTGLQPAQQQLQLFDMRYLTIEGTLNITGLLNLDIINDQTTSFYMNISFKAVTPLHSTCSVINSIPDQIINVNSIYDYQIDAKNIFSCDIQYITVTETGKTSLPNWITLNRTITNMVMQDIEGDIEASEDILYVSSGVGMQLINISNVAHPRLSGEVVVLGSSSYWGWSILLENKTAYLVQYAPYWSNTFNIIDVSNANNPTVLSSRYLGFVDLACVDVFDGVAYLGLTWTEDSDGLRVVNVSDPTNPISMNGISRQVAGANSKKIQVKNGVAYAINFPEGSWTEHLGLSLINVSNPNNVVFLGRIDWRSWGGSGARITVLDNIVYTTSDEQLLLIDVSNPYDPTILSNFTVGHYDSSCTPGSPDCSLLTDFRVVGNLAYVSNWKGWSQSLDREMHIVDVSDPKNFHSLEIIMLPPGDVNGGGGRMAINNGVGFISTTKTNLHIFSLNKLQLTGTPINVGETHSLTVTAFDYNGNNCSTTFRLQVANPSPTSTPTGTYSSTLTDSLTNTDSQTPSSTNSPTSTNSGSPTPSNTGSSTASNTDSTSPTDTHSTTLTGSPTNTDSQTSTGSSSPTSTNTGSSTVTGTDSASPTGTDSASPSSTNSPTSTNTGSPTPSNTDSVTSTNTDSATLTDSQSPTGTNSPTLTDTGTDSVTSTSTPICSPMLRQICCANSGTQIHNKKFNILAIDRSESTEQEQQKFPSVSTSYSSDKANFIAGGLAGITLGATLGVGTTLLFSYLYRKKQQAALTARLATENVELLVSSAEENINKDKNSLRRRSSCC